MGMNPIALMAAISNSQRDKMTGGGGPEITKEMLIDNAVAGSVIGKSGSKVGEIRKISGAQVHISTEDEMTPGGERVVTMCGTPESVLLAQFLVQSNIDLYKRDRDMERGPGFGGPGPLDNFVQNEAIRNNPEAMSALNQMNSMMGGPGRNDRGKGGFGRGGPNNGFGRGGNSSFDRGNSSFDRGGGNNSFDRGGGNRDNRGGGGFGRGGRRSPMEGGRRGGNGGKQKAGRRR